MLCLRGQATITRRECPEIYFFLQRAQKRIKPALMSQIKKGAFFLKHFKPVGWTVNTPAICLHDICGVLFEFQTNTRPFPYKILIRFCFYCRNGDVVWGRVWDFHSDKCFDCGPLGYDTVLSDNSQRNLPSPSLGSKYTNRTHTMTIAVVWRKYLLHSPGSSEPRKMSALFNIREINLYVSSETSRTTTPSIALSRHRRRHLRIPRCENLKPRTRLETVTSENTKPETRRVFWAVGTGGLCIVQMNPLLQRASVV